MNQLGIYFDQTRCIGCYTCSIACKDWHDHQAARVNYMQIKTIEKGTFPHLFLAYLALPCYHCQNPPCATVCPAEAITKRESDGIVVVDADKCLGKEKCPKTPCLKACRSRSPQFGDEKNAKMQKCDFCHNRLEKGQKPICVEACPMFALEIDELAKLEDTYGDIREVRGFKCSKEIGQAAVFKPKPEVYS